MELDIVLLPPKRLCEKIGQSMLNLAKYCKFWFVVDNRKLKPHISLLHLKASQKNLSLIFQATQKMAFKYSSIKFSKPHFHKGRKFLTIGFSIPSSLYRLHKSIKKILVFCEMEL